MTLLLAFPSLSGMKSTKHWKGFVPVNIKETEKNYSIEVVAPGFEKTDFKISLDQQILTISAEKQNEVKDR